MMAWSFRSGNAAAYYPGDAYVDVVAADGYNQHGCPHGNAPWRSFGDIFAPFQAFGAAWQADDRRGVGGRTHADRGCARWVSSSPQTLEAFRAMAADPYFNPPTSILTSPVPG